MCAHRCITERLLGRCVHNRWGERCAKPRTHSLRSTDSAWRIWTLQVLWFTPWLHRAVFYSGMTSCTAYPILSRPITFWDTISPFTFYSASKAFKPPLLTAVVRFNLKDKMTKTLKTCNNTVNTTLHPFQMIVKYSLFNLQCKASNLHDSLLDSVKSVLANAASKELDAK